MNCFNCGQENDDESVYCKHCGHRIDGKIQCPSCKKLIDGDSQFCGYCGYGLQENCVETPDDKDAYKGVNATNNQKIKSMPDLKKINEICIGAFSMATVFFSILFVFFIGVKTSTSSTIDSNVYTSSRNLNLIYYLGECYKNLSSLKAIYPSYYIANTTFILAMGTILAIATITTVFIFAIISLVRYVNYCAGKSNKSYSAPVVATYTAFVIGITLFYAFNTLSIKSSEYTTSVKLNEYAIAGLALSSLFMLISTICKYASLGKLLTSQQNIYKTCFTVLGLGLLIFMAVEVASPAISISDNSSNVSYNFFSAMTMIVNLVFVKDSSDYYSSSVVSSTSNDVPTEIYAQLVVSLLFQIALIIFVIYLMTALLKDLSENDKQRSFKSLIISIVISALSIGYLIITINAGNNIIEYISSESDNYYFSAVSLIPVVIVSVITMTIEIVRTVINARIKRKLI